jgi:DnaK suppressor protein
MMNHDKRSQTMARRDALVRLVKTLLTRREDQHQKLAEELRNLRDFRMADSAADSVDWAFEADSDELASRLVERDDSELSQIERAVMRWKRRTYGICESCQIRIPLARLTALPYTALCIACERRKEAHPGGFAIPSRGNWAQVADAQAPMQDQRIDLAKVQMALSGKRRD